MKKSISNTRNSKIAILSCYYGEFPWYFAYFLHSCKHNPSIIFFIITDNQSPAGLPSNVKIINKSLEKIRRTASRKLGFEVVIDDAYKLCDLKPAYGFLFPEIISDFGFWGHADVDLVYGDIRRFISNEILENYDVISSRHDYITGSFCLFRNNKKINTLFMQSKDYKKIFSSSSHYCFDECNFLFTELANGASVFDFPENIQSMTWVVKKAEAEGKLKAFFDFIIIEGNPGKIKWDNGKIIYRNSFEAMFYHLIEFKKKCKRPKILHPIPDLFYFTTKQIFTKSKLGIPLL